MATQPVGGPQAVRPRRELVEAKAPEMLKFVRQGQEIVGILINMEPITVKGGNGQSGSQTIEYTILQENGDRATFLGTNDLNKKIHPGMIGHFLAIRYESDDDSFTKAGQSPAKVFKVLVSKEKEPGY
jgi:hypothetical protein